MTTHHPLQIIWATAIALIVVLVVGCAGDATGSSGPVVTNEVTMPRSYRFAPEAIQVSAGTTVTFRNADNFTHSVKLRDGSEPDHLVKPGESVQITFAQPGTFNYECSLHPRDMRGTVIVTGTQPAADYGG
jgi:plastocyanin